MKKPKVTPLGRDPFQKQEPLTTRPRVPAPKEKIRATAKKKAVGTVSPTRRTRVLVMGANGFVGSHLAAAFIQAGYTVRCVLEMDDTGEPLLGLPVEIVRASLRSRAELGSVCEGVQTVCHAACHDLAWGRSAAQIYQWNIETTRALGQAAVAAGVKNFVHTSSVFASGRPESTTDNAALAFDRWDLQSAWSWSLYAAELEALALAGQGLRSVVVRAPVALGRGDSMPSVGGQLLLAILRQRLPGYFRQGGFNVGLVQDIAAAHVQVLQDTTASHVAILQGHNCTFRAFVHAVEHVAGARYVPDWPVPRSLGLQLAKAVRGWPARLGPLPFLTEDAVRILSEDFRLPAVTTPALPMQTVLPGSLEQMIQESVQWYRDHGMV